MSVPMDNPIEAGLALAEKQNAPPPPGPQPPQGPQHGGGGFPLVPVGGGGIIPAHEVETRGPSLLKAQGQANSAVQGAIQDIGARTVDAATHEYGQALEQERAARLREAAAQRSMAEREEELAQHQADFDQSAQALAKTSIDPNRFWASRSTGQKIAAMISLGLGGFVSGAKGGSNIGLDILNTAIDRDIKAQEDAYHVARDVVGARQTAFAMAMQKYQNVDAARAMARAAAIDSVQGTLAQNAALWKGTDAANRASMASAELQNNRMQQIANGVRFILPQAQQRTFFDPRTGLRYTEAEAKGLDKELRGYEQKREEIGLNTAGDITKELVKGDAAGQKDLRAELVTLPNGDTIRAPNAAEAVKLRDLSQAVSNAQQLVAEAKAIRASNTWRVNPSARARLHEIQSSLTVGFKNTAGLGALSGPDFDLANSGTGDLFSLSPGVDAQLDSFQARSTKALQNRVRTLPGAPETAQGKLPSDAASDFKAYGKK